MKVKISENIVARIWQHQLTTQGLATANGEQLQVIYPGRHHSDGGPDFCDAIIAVDGKVLRGDIEVHVKSSHWRTHGHHQDPDYNDLVLHVVLWHDTELPTLVQSGKSIPIACLGALVNGSTEQLYRQATSLPPFYPSCHNISKHPSKQTLVKLLDAAGEERFKTKAAFFQAALSQEEAGQVLFRGIMRALGYVKNAKAFEELAHRLPLCLLESPKPKTSLATKQAWLLGTAGLLPSQRLKRRTSATGKKWVATLERIWQSVSKAQPMKETDWEFFRVRPDNFPSRRLAAQSYLLCRYQKPGLFGGILQLVTETPLNGGQRQLEASLIIAADGYWANHFDFGVMSKTINPTLLGRGKAGEIVVNVILPFTCAWGEAAAEPQLRQKALTLYRCYPKLADNELTRYMRQQLFPEGDFEASACRQQGLIHLFKNYCQQRNCAECPIGS